MKKTYQAPSLCVTRISTETLIAASLKIDSSKSGGSALIKESNEWDIWGSDDFSDEEE